MTAIRTPLTKHDIDQSFIDDVEGHRDYGCGMGSGAWDTIDPREVIAAAVNAYLDRIGAIQ
jgi:hypothetical protein